MKIKVTLLAVFLLAIWMQPCSGEAIVGFEEMGVILIQHNGVVPGYFKTVVKGSTLKRFEVIFEGISGGGGEPRIVFSSKNPIAAGMSGSPMFLLNGRKVCALSHRYSAGQAYDGKFWGLCSSIETMLEESGKREGISDSQTVAINEKIFEKIPSGDQSIPTGILMFLAQQNGNENLAAAINGLSLTTVQFAGSALARLQSLPVLKEGMPIVADLMAWENMETGKKMSLGALGTVSHIEKNGRVYAFGHPFLDSKKVKYPFRTAKIIGTVLSDQPHKISGENSEVMGVIDYDSSFGIYGELKAGGMTQESFELEFQKEGKTFKKFKVTTAEALIKPLLMAGAMDTIGKLEGAPSPQEVLVTELTATVEINGDEEVSYKNLFAPTSFRFGPQMFYISSYQVGLGTFLNEVYMPLFSSNYKFDIGKVKIIANFIPGEPRRLKLGSCEFPNKVIWGENPVLTIELVDENNTVVAERKEVVELDWSQIEQPIYTSATKDTEKEDERIIGGSATVFSGESRIYLTENQRQSESPNYFLDYKDFLSFFTKGLSKGSSIQVNTTVRARSGLYDKKDESGRPETKELIKVEDGWNIYGGFKERKVTLKDDNTAAFLKPLGTVPDGYVVVNFSTSFNFEIVKKEAKN